MPARMMMVFEAEEIFCSSDVRFHGQPVGIVVAETNELAYQAAFLVEINYEGTNGKKIIPSLQAVFESNPERIHPLAHFSKVAAEYGVGGKHKVSGRFDIGTQYHFTMEPQTALCIPIEDGMDVYSATQHMESVQIAIAETIGVPTNTINLNVRRLGGAYGSKISRCTQVACAAALAAHLLRRPVRLVMSIESNMEVIGKRYACINDYVAEVDDNGKVQKLVNDYVEDSGCSPNEPGR